MALSLSSFLTLSLFLSFSLSHAYTHTHTYIHTHTHARTRTHTLTHRVWDSSKVGQGKNLCGGVGGATASLRDDGRERAGVQVADVIIIDSDNEHDAPSPENTIRESENPEEREEGGMESEEIRRDTEGGGDKGQESKRNKSKKLAEDIASVKGHSAFTPFVLSSAQTNDGQHDSLLLDRDSQRGDVRGAFDLPATCNCHKEQRLKDAGEDTHTCTQLRTSQDRGECAGRRACSVPSPKAQDGPILMQLHTAVTAQQQQDTETEEAGGEGRGGSLTESDGRQEKIEQVERCEQSDTGLFAFGSVNDGESHLSGRDNATWSGSIAERGGKVVDGHEKEGNSGGGMGRQTSTQQQRKHANADDAVRADWGKAKKGKNEKGQAEKGEDGKDSGDLDVGKQVAQTLQEMEYGTVHLESDSLKFSEPSKVIGAHNIDSNLESMYE